MKGFYSVRDAAKAIGVSKTQVFNYGKTGKLTIQFFDGRAYVPEAQVDGFVRNFKTSPIKDERQQPRSAKPELPSLAGDFLNVIKDHLLELLAPNLAAIERLGTIGMRSYALVAISAMQQEGQNFTLSSDIPAEMREGVQPILDSINAVMNPNTTDEERIRIIEQAEPYMHAATRQATDEAKRKLEDEKSRLVQVNG